MKILAPVLYFLLFLSIPASYISLIPNRILMVLLAIPAIGSVPREFLKTHRWKFLIAVLGFILILSFGNKYLVKDSLLFLILPAYWLILSKRLIPLSSMTALFSRAACMTFLIMLLIKIAAILSQGIDFFNQEHWWNQLLYKQFAETIEGHPAYLSLFFMIGLVFSLEKILYSSKPQRPYIQVVVLTSGLLLLAVKTFLFVLTLVVLVFALVGLYKRLLPAAILGVGLIIALSSTILFVPGIKHRVDKVVNEYNSADETSRLSERKALWKASFETINRFPFKGSSFRGLSSRDAIYESALHYYPELSVPKNAHNNFLETGVRYGYPGLVVSLLLLISLLVFNFKHPGFALVSLTIAVLSFSMTESFLFREAGLAMVAILIAIFGKHDHGKRI